MFLGGSSSSFKECFERRCHILRLVEDKYPTVKLIRRHRSVAFRHESSTVGDLCPAEARKLQRRGYHPLATEANFLRQAKLPPKLRAAFSPGVRSFEDMTWADLPLRFCYKRDKLGITVNIGKGCSL